MGYLKPAILVFSQSGMSIGTLVAKSLDAQIFQCGSGGIDAKTILPKLFAARTPVIGVCATAILVRLLAPVLEDKHAEPPVIALSNDGHYVVPVLGGHHGANVLATKIAKIVGGVAAITTASEGRYSFALDDPPPGYVLANPDVAKWAMAALLNGQKLRVQGEDNWLKEAGYPIDKTGTINIHVGEGTTETNGLIYHRKTLVAGVGCARGTDAKQIIALVDQTLACEELASQSLAAFVSIDIKSDEAGLHQAAAHFGVPLRLFGAEQLAKQKIPNPSAVVEQETGTPSVAEAAASMVGELIVEKQKTANVTCAIGRAVLPVDPENFGVAPGQLHLVGIGPGTIIQRTISATSALGAASDWVGYGLYLDLIADLDMGQKQHRFDLGDEEARVRFAMELAATGKNVALVCSGDAQIYAMAALVYELLDATGKRAVSDAARRIGVESHPGISALQMASARTGALLGHDFCTISLSDLLTPRADIEQRLLAAAKGDFVTAFYNPRSKRRTDLIEIARALFLQHRPEDTPVIIATNLGRARENVRVITLKDFNPEEVDMLTIVLFGSSNSKAFLRGDGKVVAYTPRGYANKANEKPAREVYR